jgi:hypothetical protein
MTDTGHITFKEDTHEYFNPQGVKYASVSSVLKMVKVPFDRDGRSRQMAQSMSKEEGITIDQAQKKILAEWDYKRDNSIEVGNNIHNALEKYLKTGNIDPEFDILGKRISHFLKIYHRYYPEKIFHSDQHKIAGTADLPVTRSKAKTSPIDIFDYKTNVEKGIEFDTAKFGKAGKFEKFYNRFFLPPVDHLEDCNYNLYSLQLSLYAVMAQMMTGRRIGRLGIIFINHKTLQMTMYPVSYLKLEALAIMDHFKNLKQMPVLEKSDF